MPLQAILSRGLAHLYVRCKGGNDEVGGYRWKIGTQAALVPPLQRKGGPAADTVIESGTRPTAERATPNSPGRRQLRQLVCERADSRRVVHESAAAAGVKSDVHGNHVPVVKIKSVKGFNQIPFGVVDLDAAAAGG